MTENRSQAHGGLWMGWIEAYVLPGLVVLLGTGLYLYGLASKSLWYDELSTLTNSGWGGTFWDAVVKPLTIPTTPKPPLSFVVTRLFLLLGDQVFLLRLQAAVFAVLAIPLTYTLGRALVDRWVGLLGSLLLAVAPLQVRYAQEARMYAMWLFLSVLSLYLYWRAIHSRKGRWWALFVLASVLALYTHLFALLPLGVMALFGVWLMLRSRRGAEVRFRGWHFVVAMVLILAGYAPMIPYLAEGLMSSEGLGSQASPDWGWSAILSTLRLFSSGSQAGLIVYVLLVGVAVVALARHASDVLVLAVLWLAVPPVVILGLPFGHALLVRYFVYGLPVYLLLVAGGLRVVFGWCADRLGRRLGSAGARRAILALVAALLVGGLVGLHVPRLTAYYAETKLNWRDAVWLVNTLAEPGEQVFVPHEYHRKGFLFYVAQFPPGKNQWSEETVRIVPHNLAEAFPPGGDERQWLIAKGKTRFMRDGLEALAQLHYSVQPLDVFTSSRRPLEAKIIAPRSYGTLVVVPVEPAGLPAVRFWYDGARLKHGQCTWLHWDVRGVREVYLAGEAVVGQAHRKVCPNVSTSYELEIVHLDGTVTRQAIEIEVVAP